MILFNFPKQKTHQQLANEKQLYIVERREECLNYPRVVATPENGYIRTEEEIPNDEELDFHQVFFTYCFYKLF